MNPWILIATLGAFAYWLSKPTWKQSLAPLANPSSQTKTVAPNSNFRVFLTDGSERTMSSAGLEKYLTANPDGVIAFTKIGSL